MEAFRELSAAPHAGRGLGRLDNRHGLRLRESADGPLGAIFYWSYVCVAEKFVYKGGYQCRCKRKVVCFLEI